jgi:hypothetical protein
MLQRRPSTSSRRPDPPAPPKKRRNRKPPVLPAPLFQLRVQSAAQLNRSKQAIIALEEAGIVQPVRFTDGDAAAVYHSVGEIQELAERLARGETLQQIKKALSERRARGNGARP